MIELYKISDQERLSDTTHLNVMITDRCNNKCWYCYANNSVNDMSKHTFGELLVYIKNQNRGNVDIHLIGGEPSVHPNFIEYLNKLSEIDNVDIHITTNLMVGMDVWEKIPSNVTLSASYHSDWAKDDGWFDKTIYLHNRCQLENVMLLVQSNNIHHIRDIWLKYKDLLPLKIQVITQHYDLGIDVSGLDEHVEQSSDVDESQIEVLLKDGTRDDENYTNYNNFKGMLCSNGFFVNPMGELFYCENFEGNKNSCGTLSNPPKSQWHICPFSRCDNDYEFQKCSIQYYTRNIK